jgi:hypothetical protein
VCICIYYFRNILTNYNDFAMAAWLEAISGYWPLMKHRSIIPVTSPREVAKSCNYISWYIVVKGYQRKFSLKASERRTNVQGLSRHHVHVSSCQPHHHQVVGESESPEACEFTGENTLVRQTLRFSCKVPSVVAEVGSLFQGGWPRPGEVVDNKGTGLWRWLGSHFKM